MALLTKNGYNNVLTRIWETGGLTKDMEGDLERLKADFDEREGMLRKYGEVYDGEDRDEYEFIEKISNDDWKGKYEEMKERYKNRFFRGEPNRDNYDQGDFKTVIDNEMKDIKKDSEPHTWDELLATSSNEKQDKEVNEDAN